LETAQQWHGHVPSPTYEMIAYRRRVRFDGAWAPRFLTILTGRNLPRIIGQSREPEPSIINEKTIAYFTRVVEQTGILEREPLADKARSPED
jgi:hypothetical protein